MDNLQKPAFPYVIPAGTHSKDTEVYEGLTKIEKASLMIAQRLVTDNDWNIVDSERAGEISVQIAKTSILIATAVLEETNKPSEKSEVLKMLRAVTERLEWMTVYAEMGDDAGETETDAEVVV